MQEYFRRVGEHANEIFLSIENLGGPIIGGPGTTKYDFEKGDHLNYMLKNKVIGIIDTAYVDEQGVRTLLLSEELDVLRVTIKCNACGYERHTLKSKTLTDFEQSLIKLCPKCKAPSLSITDTEDL